MDWGSGTFLFELVDIYGDVLDSGPVNLPDIFGSDEFLTTGVEPFVVDWAVKWTSVVSTDSVASTVMGIGWSSIIGLRVFMIGVVVTSLVAAIGPSSTRGKVILEGD